MATYILPATTTVEAGGRFTASGPSTLTGAITLTGNVVTDVLFTDATFDIGKNGATRPRDIFSSRDIACGRTLSSVGDTNVSGTLTASGNATVAGTLGVTAKASFTVAPMVPASSGSAVFGIDCTDTGVTTIANNATGTPVGNANNFSGLFIVTDTTVTGETGIFVIGAVIALVAQSGTVYTITSGTGGKINVYLTAGVLTVENKQGNSIGFRFFALRTRVSA